MGKFIYKFDSIKKVKETLEKKVQKEVASLTREIELAQEEYEKVLEELLLHKKNPQKGNYKLSELQFRENYEKNLHNKMNEISIRITQLNLQKDKKIEELKQRSREHEIFNTLEENYLEEFIDEEKKTELKQLNEIAIQKFTEKQ